MKKWKKNDRNRYALLTLSNSHAVANIIYSFFAIVKPTIRSSFCIYFENATKMHAIPHSLWVFSWYQNQLYVHGSIPSLHQGEILTTKLHVFFFRGYKTTTVWLSRVLLCIHVCIAFFSRSLFHLQRFFFFACNKTAEDFIPPKT